MKWSELTCPGRNYGEYNDKEMIIRGWFLDSIGVDLDHISEELFESCELFEIDGIKLSEPYEAKVDIRDIAGTTRKDYAGGTWIDAFLRECKVVRHIKAGHVTRGKYFRMLKKRIAAQMPCVSLVKAKNGSYYVFRNGNHRVTFYKLMYLAELASKGHDTNKYWLYAEVCDEL